RLRALLGMKREITNATLIQMRTYNSGQGELGALLDTCRGEWRRFVRAISRLEVAGPWFDREQEGEVGRAVAKVTALGCPGEEAVPLPANVAAGGSALDRPNAGR